MSEERNGELFEAVNKVQWVLGESMFRAKKLKSLLASDEKLVHGLERELNELLLALSQITNLYRHNIAERIKALIR